MIRAFKDRVVQALLEKDTAAALDDRLATPGRVTVVSKVRAPTGATETLFGHERPLTCALCRVCRCAQMPVNVTFAPTSDPPPLAGLEPVAQVLSHVPGKNQGIARVVQSVHVVVRVTHPKDGLNGMLNTPRHAGTTAASITLVYVVASWFFRLRRLKILRKLRELPLQALLSKPEATAQAMMDEAGAAGPAARRKLSDSVEGGRRRTRNGTPYRAMAGPVSNSAPSSYHLGETDVEATLRQPRRRVSSRRRTTSGRLCWAEQV